VARLDHARLVSTGGDETCPFRTGRGTRRVQLVREGRRGGGSASITRASSKAWRLSTQMTWRRRGRQARAALLAPRHPRRHPGGGRRSPRTTHLPCRFAQRVGVLGLHPLVELAALTHGTAESASLRSSSSSSSSSRAASRRGAALASACASEREIERNMQRPSPLIGNTCAVPCRVSGSDSRPW